MHIKIKVLNVGDGDAIIVSLRKEEKKIVFMIDGGRARNSDVVMPALEEMLKEAGIEGPEFILCTHYDDDHIGGLPEIAKKYAKTLKTIWLHKTSVKVGQEILTGKIASRPKRRGILPSQSGRYLQASSYAEFTQYQRVIRDLQQEIKFLDLLKTLAINTEEPVAGQFIIEGWPELTIISPTETLYRSLFPAKFKGAAIIRAEVSQLQGEEIAEGVSAISEDPNQALDHLPKTTLTPTNVNSAVLLLTVCGKKLLFAGDAGIRSLTSIPDHDELLAGIYWLKVPHHGSKNNLDSKLITLMRPVHAVISGNKHISPQVVKCFEHINCNLKTTRDDGTIVFEETFNCQQGLSEAKHSD
ncbi:MBL fold metallo-hydrolase [Mucilaginibacter sp. CAU 1740]|uniref:ComEC/Rec2 family competence protein n=1 Tax=Mucilaginibacter sp. CAU 1740 TaxID=3140365 RepID=UPI00325AD4EA